MPGALFIEAALYCAGFREQEHLAAAIDSADEAMCDGLSIDPLASVKNTALHLLAVLAEGRFDGDRFCALLLLLPEPMQYEQPYCLLGILNEYDGVYLTEKACRQQIETFLSWK